jgi:geranylgeranyl diphosphate synthase type I
MPLDTLANMMLPEIEAELRRAVEQAGGPGLDPLRHMLAYHLGWEGEGAGPEASGKRLRPLLVLLACAAAGGEWRAALPAAAAVELVHNFSLIHDDIEDNSPLRRGRPTVWTQWGIPQAINAGDAMFTLAFLAILRLEETISLPAALEGSRLLQTTCLRLTQGQYLDISFEQRSDLRLEDYWPMVTGKTAALLSAGCELGALAAGCGDAERAAYRQFGLSLGLAFQAQDDLLGIWGDSALTGKSAESDLVSGKKSLPVLYGLARPGAFARRWAQGPIQPGQAAEVAALLEAEGARRFTEAEADRLTGEALSALESAHPQGEAGAALRVLALKLVKRNV